MDQGTGRDYEELKREVHFESSGALFVITLDRPDARNAINQSVADGIAVALREFENSQDARVAILTGSSGYFSAGMDLEAFARGEMPFSPEREFAGLADRTTDKPIIAAVEGFALAGGLELALACDLIVSGRGALLGVPETKRSLVAKAGALWRLPARIGVGATMRLALTGDSIRAEDAHRMGLVDELSEDGGALGLARSIGERIAANGPLAVQATRRIINAQVRHQRLAVSGIHDETADRVFASADAREGALAFKEKRVPCWKSC